MLWMARGVGVRVVCMSMTTCVRSRIVHRDRFLDRWSAECLLQHMCPLSGMDRPSIVLGPTAEAFTLHVVVRARDSGAGQLSVRRQRLYIAVRSSLPSYHLMVS